MQELFFLLRSSECLDFSWFSPFPSYIFINFFCENLTNFKEVFKQPAEKSFYNKRKIKVAKVTKKDLIFVDYSEIDFFGENTLTKLLWLNIMKPEFLVRFR